MSAIDDGRIGRSLLSRIDHKPSMSNADRASGAWRAGFIVTTFLGSLHIQQMTQAQTPNGAATSAEEGGELSAMDRGKMRLNLLMTLTDNELEEANLAPVAARQLEAAGLDQERRKMQQGAESRHQGGRATDSP